MREEDRTHPDVVHFDCGEDEWAREVAAFLVSGQAWEEHGSGLSQTWVLEAGTHIAGFVTLVKRQLSYPKWNGKRKVPSLLVAFIAVGTRFQKQGYAKSMLQSIIVTAYDDPKLALVYLLVDERNPAVGLYRDLGFTEHPTWPVHEDEPRRYLRMTLGVQQ